MTDGQMERRGFFWAVLGCLLAPFAAKAKRRDTTVPVGDIWAKWYEETPDRPPEELLEALRNVEIRFVEPVAPGTRMFVGLAELKETSDD